MSNKFTRNITKIKDIKKQGLDTNNPNDLISLTDNKTVYLRREKDYHCLTDNVKSIKINSTEFLADENNHVTTQKLTEKVDKYSPNENGFISTDYPLSVNGQTIDNKTNRNITIDTGVLTVNGQAPDENGNIELNNTSVVNNTLVVNNLYMFITKEDEDYYYLVAHLFGDFNTLNNSYDLITLSTTTYYYNSTINHGSTLFTIVKDKTLNEPFNMIITFKRHKIKPLVARRIYAQCELYSESMGQTVILTGNIDPQGPS